MSGAGMLLDGDRTSGMDVRNANVTAAVAIANIVKTSLGPVGLDKMLVDEIGDVTITNDGATILAQLDIEHPAAKVLVELAQLQDQEVGDGTTSVVIVASELLKKANELVKNGIHPTVVMAGYRVAVKEAVKYIKENLVVKGEDIGPDNLISAGTFFYPMLWLICAYVATLLTLPCFFVFPALPYDTDLYLHSENIYVFENNWSRVHLLLKVGCGRCYESTLREGWALQMPHWKHSHFEESRTSCN